MSSELDQESARSLVLQLQMIIRTVRIHASTNLALQNAAAKLCDRINTLREELGGRIKIQFVEGEVFVNNERVRLDSATRGAAQFLTELFKARGMGGLGFAEALNRDSIIRFFGELSRPIESEQAAEELRASLASLKELALEILGPKSFNPEQVEASSLKIDRKTFALQSYAKCVVGMREFIECHRDRSQTRTVRMPMARVVQDLVDIADERVNLLLKLAVIKQAGEYWESHAANTCVMSLVMGRALRIERLDLVDLGLAALYANVGYALMDDPRLEVTEELSDADKNALRESAILHTRCLLGSGKLNLGRMRRVIVACEHHQAFKPAHHLFSRIVGVAGAFDALSTVRPWREAFPPDEALRILLQDEEKRFDPNLVRLLVNLIGLYPLGTEVELATGERGVVYHNNHRPEAFSRPWVKLTVDRLGQSISKTELRDLSNAEGDEAEIVRTLGLSE